MLLNCDAGKDSWESLGQQRSNQSILKKINPEYSLEGLMLKLKLQHFGHLIGRADSLKDSDAGKDWEQEEKGGDSGWDGWMVLLTQWTWVWVNSRRQWREVWCAAAYGVTKNQRPLSEWTTVKVVWKEMRGRISIKKKKIKNRAPHLIPGSLFCSILLGSQFSLMKVHWSVRHSVSVSSKHHLNN